jgi:hypothetical protein
MGAPSFSIPIDDRVDDGPLACEQLLPVQLADLLHGTPRRTPELRLMGAVLEDAIRCFCQCAGSPGVRSQKLFRETGDWFESHDASWPFAFENVCDALGLDPGWIRRLLTRWRSDRTRAAGWPAPIPNVRLRIAGSRHTVSVGAPWLGTRSTRAGKLVLSDS